MNLLSTSHKDHFAHKVWTGLRLSEVVNSEASAETFAKKACRDPSRSCGIEGVS